MSDAFESRVRAAAAAAWWTLVTAAAFLLLQWLLYLGVMSAKPEWAVSFWGPGQTWESIRLAWFHALLVVKLTLWPFLLAAIWLTLWARRMRKRTSTSA